MVRFLRNATVAKIAGKDSHLLQISSEERERVARVAELFSEEDLTRHLQIMLRTHGELGYKQEQRFHLELGLLKMSHAQKLIPLEQLLGDVASAPSTSAQKPPTRPSIVSGSAAPDARRPEQPGQRSNFVSPFAADSARKGTPRQEDSAPSTAAPGPRIVAQASQPEPVIMGSAAPATQRNPEPVSDQRDVATLVAASAMSEPEREPPPRVEEKSVAVAELPEDVTKVQNAVLEALINSGQNFLASMLSSGEWSVQGNEVVIKITESQTVLDMSLGNDARRIAIATASGVLGRAVKIRVVPGATVAAQPKRNGSQRPAGGPGARGRAEEDPVVRRMQEKFGAEIRTVIDYREKR